MKTTAAISSTAANIQDLWGRLSQMEGEHRFGGREYPLGTVKFPFYLKGQGFFAGGDGLWRDDDNLESESDGVLPSGGIVFIGNDFGSLSGFKRLTRGFENPLTWRNLKARVRAANLPTELTFFTNAFVGLRESGRALDSREWSQMPLFCSYCTEFLTFQLEQLSPKLVVLMGPKSQESFDALIRKSSLVKSFQILKTGHPYADFSLSDARKLQDVRLLANAWEAVS
jgi:hypothetical protein